MAIEYKKEFFDRSYTAREAYACVWKYARKYRFRIVLGIVCASERLFGFRRVPDCDILLS